MLCARLQALSSKLDQLPEVDRQRVAELRQQVADGSYVVDPRAVAEKLTEFEALLRANAGA